MPFSAGLSLAPESSAAAGEACAAARDGFAGTPDLAVLFATPHHLDKLTEVAERVRSLSGTRCLVGCVGESVVGNGREVEEDPAVAVWLGSWDGAAEVVPFHLTPHQTPDGLSLLGWPDALLDGDPAGGLLVTLGDPYTFPAVESFLPTVNDDFPGLAVAGGQVSGTGPGVAPLALDGRAVELGAVGVYLRGVPFRTVVSQGCRPVGRPLVVTKGQTNVIAELSGRSPLLVLRELYNELTVRERALFERGLHIGLVMTEYRETFDRGDFLIRNLLSIDRASGALAVADRVRVGQTVQFQIRDAEAAGEDLRALLAASGTGRSGRPAGGLLFTCNGRGTRLFPEPDHDAKTVRSVLGEMPLAGFFAAGELGRVGGKNYIHGFTASAVVFEESGEGFDRRTV